MQRLIAGVHHFQKREFGKYRELFQRLAKDGQRPHTLFITCSDSRILAELITHSQPGDLFVVKNVGNMVPPATAVGSTNSTAAAVEFAVDVLRVDDVVVCGHSQCGAMAALMGGAVIPADARNLREWLEVASPVREVINQQYPHLSDSEARVTAAGEENVLFALENLRTYPAVQRRLADGSPAVADTGAAHLYLGG